ncbi:hypothetical protein CK203_087794 [Vitis vinifera]|uniref:Uncharacterized protein n=1 Tax=Vitis vinifera TaxID=29760 RepID=A0A438CVD6_VITVI|nr:hypothetical protein CK203_087794 [Vitis vinifera]
MLSWHPIVATAKSSLHQRIFLHCSSIVKFNSGLHHFKGITASNPLLFPDGMKRSWFPPLYDLKHLKVETVPLCREGLARRMQTVAAVAGVGYDMKNVLNMMMRRFYSSSSLIM